MKTIKQKVLEELHKETYLFNEKFVKRVIDLTIKEVLKLIDEVKGAGVDGRYLTKEELKQKIQG